MTQKQLYFMVLIVGLIPTIGVFVWGINQSLKTNSEPIVPLFSQMK
ncbi:MAG: hypothetical protein ABI758_00955 [Candidatus Woesebacteria bacterium]